MGRSEVEKEGEGDAAEVLHGGGDGGLHGRAVRQEVAMARRPEHWAAVMHDDDLLVLMRSEAALTQEAGEGLTPQGCDDKAPLKRLSIRTCD